MPPSCVWYWERCQQAPRLVSSNFIQLTRWASRYVLVYIPGQMWPMVLSFQQLDGFLGSVMASHRVIVVP